MDRFRAAPAAPHGFLRPQLLHSTNSPLHGEQSGVGKVARLVASHVLIERLRGFDQLRLDVE